MLTSLSHILFSMNSLTQKLSAIASSLLTGIIEGELYKWVGAGLVKWLEYPPNKIEVKTRPSQVSVANI